MNPQKNYMYFSQGNPIYQPIAPYVYQPMHPNYMGYQQPVHQMYYQHPMYSQFYQQQNQSNPPSMQTHPPQPQQQIPQQANYPITSSSQSPRGKQPKLRDNSLSFTSAVNGKQPAVSKNPQQNPESSKTQFKMLTAKQIRSNIEGFSHLGFCHYCNKNGKICYYCFASYAPTECKHGFCFDCLTFHFKINPIKILLKADWQCPIRCRQCNCSKCSNAGTLDSEQFVSNDSVESYNRFSHLIENTKKIKRQFQKRRQIIKEIYSIKFQNLDPKKKKQQQLLAQKRTLNANRIKRQLQFSSECLAKLKQIKNPLSQQDEQILHQVIRYNFESIQDQLKELNGIN